MPNLDDLRIDAPVPKPRRRSRPPWVPVVLLLFIVFLVLYFNRDRLIALSQSAMQQSNPQLTDQADSAADSSPESIPRSPTGNISAAGYLEIIPPGPTTVSVLVSGRLSEISVIPGQQVKTGDIVAMLDSSLLRQRAAVLRSDVELAQRQLELQQAGFRSEEISQARASLESAQANQRFAQNKLERSSDLLEKGVIARQEFEADETSLSQAQSAVEDAAARLELLEAGTRTEEIRIAEARLATSTAELNRVYWEIEQCTIRAPRDGMVLEQLAQPGDWLQPGTDNPDSAAILSIFDPSRIQAWVDVNQRDSGGLFIGQRVEMTTDAQPQRIVSGTVNRIMPRANLQKNTVQAKISISEVPPDFLPELSVKVTFLPAETDSEESSSNAPNSSGNSQLEGI